MLRRFCISVVVLQTLCNLIVKSDDNGKLGHTYDIQLTVVPSMDDGPIIWQQTVTISCSWEPGNRMYGDFVVGEELGSIWSDWIYGEIVSLDDPEQRVYLRDDDDIGVATLIIKNVTAIDARLFGCMVSRVGNSNITNLDILEPPTTGVTNLRAFPEFTSANLTWNAVEGATNYNVQWQVVGSANWTQISTSDNFYTISGLPTGSFFIARVSASNDAGIREGIVSAEVSCRTKERDSPELALVFYMIRQEENIDKRYDGREGLVIAGLITKETGELVAIGTVGASGTSSKVADLICESRGYKKMQHMTTNADYLYFPEELYQMGDGINTLIKRVTCPDNATDISHCTYELEKNGQYYNDLYLYCEENSDPTTDFSPTYYTTESITKVTDDTSSSPFTSEHPTEEEIPTADNGLEIEFGGLKLKTYLERLRGQWHF